MPKRKAILQHQATTGSRSSGNHTSLLPQPSSASLEPSVSSFMDADLEVSQRSDPMEAPPSGQIP
eukprot:scaffold89895_cov50-Prasinocladus_malaysianus.AAC.1